VDPAEAAKFAKMAATWWDKRGPFGPLHSMNTVRCKFIREGLIQHLGLDSRSIEPLKGLRVVDVGCGGGILSEALARMGADVTGIDVVEENIR
jgi:ubiquinone biosynthesis O-methyltransferase